jgi:cobalt-zinc-cadmium efflux system protein
MKYYGFYWVDSLLSVLIAGYLIYSSTGIIKHSTRILMQAVPKHIDVDNLKEQILSQPEVKAIKELHIWQLNEHETYLQAEIIPHKDLYLSDLKTVRTQLKKKLSEKGVCKLYLIPVNAD